MFCVHLHVLRAYEVISMKNHLFVAYVKMTKFGTKISLFVTCFFFVFFHRPRKNARF
jgi:hypothetical protein